MSRIRRMRNKSNEKRVKSSNPSKRCGPETHLGPPSSDLTLSVSGKGTSSTAAHWHHRLGLPPLGRHHAIVRRWRAHPRADRLAGHRSLSRSFSVKEAGERKNELGFSRVSATPRFVALKSGRDRPSAMDGS
jgi:hypothetical protein